MEEDIYTEFYADSQAHIEGIEESILKFENNPSESELIDDIFRRAHSIKGNAGVLGITSIHTEGQKFESFLEGIRERRKATPEELDQMLAGLDALKAVIGHERDAKIGLKPAQQTPKAAPAPPPPPPAPPKAAAPKPSVAPAPPVPAPPSAPKTPAAPVAPPSPAPAAEAHPVEGEQAAKPSAPAAPVTQTFLLFDLSGERYGVEITRVREIILMDSITAVPNTKPFVRGVMNLRDQIIPIFDLKMKLGLGLDENPEKNIIIIEISKVTTGLMVDEVTGIINLTQKEITPAANFGGSISGDYLYGMGNVGNGAIMLLNALELCDPNEILF